MARRRRNRRSRYTRRHKVITAKRSLRLSKPFKPTSTGRLTFNTIRREQPVQRQTVLKQSTKKVIQRKNFKKTSLTALEKKRKMICKRRAERKQIMHALNKAGRSGQRRPDNRTRNISCH
jgi:hypothetical protein